MPMVMATAMPKNTPVPMSRRAAEPGPEANSSGRRPSIKEAQSGRGKSRRQGGFTFVALFFGELHYKYGVLGYKAHEHHQTYLEVHVAFKSADPYAQIGAHTSYGQRQNHRQRYGPALVECRQEQEDQV